MLRVEKPDSAALLGSNIPRHTPYPAGPGLSVQHLLSAVDRVGPMCQLLMTAPPRACRHMLLRQAPQAPQAPRLLLRRSPRLHRDARAGDESKQPTWFAMTSSFTQPRFAMMRAVRLRLPHAICLRGTLRAVLSRICRAAIRSTARAHGPLPPQSLSRAWVFGSRLHRCRASVDTCFESVSSCLPLSLFITSGDQLWPGSESLDHI